MQKNNDEKDHPSTSKGSITLSTVQTEFESNSQKWIKGELDIEDFKMFLLLQNVTEIQPSLLKLFDLMKDQLNAENPTWNKHKEMVDLMKSVINKFCEQIKLLQLKQKQEICERILDYILKLILVCDHEETIESAWNVLSEFKFKFIWSIANLGSSLILFIESMKTKLAAEQHEWDKHRKICVVMQEVLQKYKKSLTEEIRNSMLEYLIELIERCDGETMISALDVLREFPFQRSHLSIDKFHSSLQRLVDSIENQLTGELCEWNAHVKLCEIMNIMLKKFKKSLTKQTCTRMFQYLKKLFDRCEDSNTISTACDALGQFPFNKYQSLLLELIDLVEKQFNSEHCGCDKHGEFCRIIKMVLHKYNKSLNGQTYERILNYFMKLIETCDNDKTIKSACGAFAQLSLDKCQTSLLELTDLVENKNEEQNKWDTDEKLCIVMMEVIIKYKNTLSSQTCERIFNYLMKIIEKCDHNETIERAWDVLTLFPFDKFQSSLLALIDFVKNKANEEPDRWDADEKLCWVMREVFMEYTYTLSNQTYERILNYLMKLIETCDNDKTIKSACGAFAQLSLDKCQTSLLALTDLVENKNEEQNKWDTDEKLCRVMMEVIIKYKNTLSSQTCERIFNYLMKIIEKCDHIETIERAWDVLTLFPFGKFQSSLLALIDFVKNKANEEPDRWDADEKLCWVMKEVFMEYKDTLSDQTCERIFNYLMKLIEKCDHNETIEYAWNLLEQHNLVLLINFFENRLNSEETKWDKHEKMIQLLIRKIRFKKLQFNHQTNEQMFDYLMKLFETCDHAETSDLAWNALIEFQFDKYQHKLGQLIHSFEARLNSKQPEWDKHGKICKIIKVVLEKYNESLMSHTHEGMFDYIKKIIENCFQAETIASAWDALANFPFSKYQLSLVKLIDSPENEIHTEQQRYDKHWNICNIIYNALKFFDNLFDNETVEKMFNFLLKLTEQYEDNKIITQVFGSLSYFLTNKSSFNMHPKKIELLFLKLIELTETKIQMNYDQRRHMCNSIERILKYHPNWMPHQTIFNYLVKIIETCDHEETIESAWNAVKQMPFAISQILLLKLFESAENKIYNGHLKSGQYKYKKLCEVINELFKQCNTILLSYQTCDRIVDFLIKVFSRSDDEIIDEVCNTLKKFPFDKYQSSLVRLIESMQNQLNADECKWKRLGKFCEVLIEVLEKYKKSFTLQVCGQVLDYLIKLIEKCDHQETIESACDALRQFPFDKYQSLIVTLVNSVENLINTEQNVWIRHGNICVVIKMMMGKHFSFLSRQTCDGIFDFIMKLFDKSDNEETIDRACNALANFPFNKFSFQFEKYESSLHKLIISREKQFNFIVPVYNNHLVLCTVICGTLINRKNSLSQEIYNKIFDYIMKLIEHYDDAEIINQVYSILYWFPFAKNQFQFDKYESSLLKLIDLRENELLSKQIAYLKKWNLCNVLQWALKNCPTSFSHKIYEKIFNFTSILINLFEDCEIINEAFNVLAWFPFSQYQSSLLQLIDGIAENFLKTEQNFWDIHRGLCEVIGWQLEKCKDLLSQEICEKSFDYLLRLICRCEDEEVIDTALEAFRKYPFNKHQSSFIKLIDTMETQMITEQNAFDKHKICEIIKELFKEYKDFLNQQTHDQIYSYLKKNNAFGNDDCSEIETTLLDKSLSKLTTFMTGHLNAKQSIYAAQELTHLQGGQIDFKFSTIYDILMKDLQSKELQPNNCMHENWCMALNQLLKNNLLNSSNQSIKSQLIDYLLQLFSLCKEMKTILTGILLAERVVLKEKYTCFKVNLLKDKMLGHLNYNDNPFSHGLPEEFNFTRYQVDWCARWCVDNLMERGKQMKEFPLIKLSSDRFGVRNDNELNEKNLDNEDNIKCHPVCSPFSATNGVYFYEVIIVTTGEMKFGWSTKETELNTNEVDENSIFSSQKCVWHANKQWDIPNRTDYQAGDLIGCLIDFDRQRFVFYYNGQAIECVTEEDDLDMNDEKDDKYVKDNVIKGITFSSSPYYATAFLSHRQQCYFNFGQSPFKFAPKDIHFSHFNEASCGDERKYQLSETCSIGDCYELFYWFKHSAVDNKIDLYYADNKQLEYDEFVNAVEEDIRNNRNIRKWEENSKEIDEKKCSFLRCSQSIVEGMGKVIFGFKVDVMAQWIGTVFDRWIDRATEAKLLELLYPYLQLHIELFERTENFHRHRNICIMLYYLIVFSKIYHQNFINHIDQEMFSYLTRILVETNDEWTQMFALIALESLDLNESEKKTLQNNKKIIDNLKKWKDYFEDKNILKNLYSNLNSQFPYQLHFLSERFLNQLLTSPPEPESKPARLNPNDRTEHLKLSLDLLSARSDRRWQSVRSNFQGIYYYEAILLTNGPMQIGWSTKQKELVQGEDGGGDEFSIGFDGFNQCVWHNRIKLKFIFSLTRWKAGDVVGCLIDVSQKLFSFYLNGHLMGYKVLPINFSSQSCDAFISLSSHQHVYLNFGQYPFKYQPKKDYLDFCNLNLNQSLPIDSINLCKKNLVITPQSNIGTIKRRIQKILSNKRKLSDDSLIEDGEPSFLTCKVCQTNISTKRLKLDCCEHIQYNTGHIPPASSQIIKLDGDSIVKCNLCDHFKNCSECKSKDCIQCQEIPSTSSWKSFITQRNEQNIECKDKIEIKNSNPLEFINNCDHGKMCNHRLKPILDCPKYNEIRLSPKSLSIQLTNIQTDDKISNFTQITPIKSSEIEVEVIASNNNNNQQQNNSKIIEFDWEIEKFSSYYYRKDSETEIKSNLFSANENSPNKYYLCLWPNGCDENVNDFVSIKLYLQSCYEAMIEVNCRISILDWDGDSYYHDEGRGWLSPIQSNLASTRKQFNPPTNSANISFHKYIACDRILDPKNGLLPEDTLTIQCKIEEKQFKEEL